MRVRFLATVFTVVSFAGAAGASYVQVISSFDATYSGAGPAWYAYSVEYDGTYLWGINNVYPQPNLALRMLFVSDITVSPASVGRIKALYR